MTDQERHHTSLLLQRLAHATLLDGRPNWALVYARAAQILSGKQPGLLALRAYAAFGAGEFDDAKATLDTWREADEAAPHPIRHLLSALLAGKQDDRDRARSELTLYADRRNALQPKGSGNA